MVIRRERESRVQFSRVDFVSKRDVRRKVQSVDFENNLSLPPKNQEKSIILKYPSHRFLRDKNLIIRYQHAKYANCLLEKIKFQR